MTDWTDPRTDGALLPPPQGEQAEYYSDLPQPEPWADFEPTVVPVAEGCYAQVAFTDADAVLLTLGVSIVEFSLALGAEELDDLIEVLQRAAGVIRR